MTAAGSIPRTEQNRAKRDNDTFTGREANCRHSTCHAGESGVMWRPGDIGCTRANAAAHQAADVGPTTGREADRERGDLCQQCREPARIGGDALRRPAQRAGGGAQRRGDFLSPPRRQRGAPHRGNDVGKGVAGIGVNS